MREEGKSVSIVSLLQFLKILSLFTERCFSVLLISLHPLLSVKQILAFHGSRCMIKVQHL